MAVFNPQTQYTTDVTTANQQVAETASESAQFWSSLIKAEQLYQSSREGYTSKTIKSIAPLLQDFKKMQAEAQERREAELLNEQYEEEQLLSDEQLSLQYKDKEYKSKEALLSDLNAQANLAGTTETLSGNPFIGKELLLGDPNQKNALKYLAGVAEDVPNVLGMGGAELQFVRNNGTSFTRDSATSMNDYQTAERTLRTMIIRQARQGGASDTQIRKYLHPTLKKHEAALRLKFIQAQRQSILESKKREITKELYNGLKTNGPIAIEKHIKENAGFYSPGVGDLRVAREKTVAELIKMAKTGQFNRQDLNKFRDHKLDANDGSKPRVEDYWKKDYNELAEAVLQFETEELKDRENVTKIEMKKQQLADEELLKNQEEPVTEDQLEAMEDAWYKNPGFRRYGRPEHILKYYTLQDEEDDGIIDRLKDKATNGVPIDPSELGGITDRDKKLNLSRQLKVSNLTAMSQEKRDDRDEDIEGNVAKKLDELNAETTKSQAYRNSVRGATKHFNNEYARYITENPNNPDGAWDKAWDSTYKGIQDGRWEKRTPTPLNDATSINLSKTYDAISKNPNIINEAVLPAVTEQDLANGLRAINGEVQYPAIFYQLQRRLSKPGRPPLSVHDITLAQVNRGLINKGLKPINPDSPKVDDDMRKALTPRERNEVNKGPAGLNKVLEEAEDVSWYTDNTKDLTAMRNGGYDYILSPDGGDAHLDKPLTKHTVGEVVELLGRGYGNLTAYAMSPKQFIDTAVVSKVEPTAILTKKLQDILAKNIPKATLKHRNDLTGFYGSNETNDLS